MIDESLWRAAPLPAFPPKQLPDRVDVVVIGGGITGVTAAYLLKRAGKTVALFERYGIGAGDTGNTTAHLTHVIDLRLSEMAKHFGKPAARAVWQGHAAAIDFIESSAGELGIDCNFQRVPGFLCAPFLDKAGHEPRHIRDDAELAAELGFPASYVENGPLTGKPAMRVADQAEFHPLAYIGGLATAIDGDGSFVCEQSDVTEVQENPLAVVVNGQRVECGDVVIATHMPFSGSAGALASTLLQTKLYPYTSYVLGATLDEGTLNPGLYFDTSDPYLYLRVFDRPEGRYAILGGEDHKTGQETDTMSHFDSLERAFRELVPQAKIDRRWSGRVIDTDDSLAFIGEIAPHHYVATGYAGNGMTFGTLAGMMIHDAISGVYHPLRALLDPNRKPTSPSSIATFLGENVDFPFYYITDRLRRSRGGVESVGPGEGKVLTIDGKHVACSRTSDGDLIKVSAVCTHMGCLVRWNNAERSWDCPCHGSRFTPEGAVLGGPAETPLERLAD